MRRQLRIVERTATRRTHAVGSADATISAHRRQAREYASRTTSWASAGLRVMA